MQGEDPPRPIQGASGQGGHGAAGEYLLGRLEHQPNPAREFAGGRQAGQAESGAQHHRSVDVVAAGVGDAGD